MVVIPSTPDTGPVDELGAVRQWAGIPGNLEKSGWSWSSYIDDVEQIPELAWPNSTAMFHAMRSESQIDALYLGTTLPIRGMRWSINPNGASARAVERACQDTGLPVKGRENEKVKRRAHMFSWDDHLSDALLALLYAHFYFEVVGKIGSDEWWHMTKLAPRHPRTIQDFDVNAAGDLRAIRQNVQGQRRGPLGVGWPGGAVIPGERLIGYVWGREAGSHIGRSMLRAMYREWLVKDRLVRIDAINHERAGGVPVAEGPKDATAPELARLARMARQFKVTEGGGGAIPYGSKMHLVSAGGTDVIASMRYCDESMARVWMLMLTMLGQTATGSRALGGTFENVAVTFREAIAKWICRVFDEQMLEAMTEWNEGDTAEYAPKLHCEPAGNSGSLAAADLVGLVEAGAIVLDEPTRAWVRGQYDMPEADPDTAVPDPLLKVAQVAGLGPDGKPIDPEAEPEPVGAPPGPSAGTAPARRRRPVRQVQAALTLPDRPLRRQPYDVEVAAAADFKALDTAHALATDSLQALYVERVIPAQIADVVAQITTTKAGDPRKVATRLAMAKVAAHAFNVDEVHAALLDAAYAGAAAAVKEAAQQGALVEMPSDEVLSGLVADHSKAVAEMTAHGISLAAQRKAVSLVGSGRGPEEIASETADYLTNLKHKWTTDQLQGAVTMAQNAARGHVFREALHEIVADVYASEILDSNTCAPCIANDGRSYDSIEDAIADYASGGFNACDGGPLCRGTLVIVRAEQDTSPEANPLVPA